MFDLADIWSVRTGHEVTLVSANDHVHARRSMHYAGLAVDLHSSAPDALAWALRQLGYRVLWRVPGHFGHLHVEVPQSRADEPAPAAPAAGPRFPVATAGSASAGARPSR